MSRYDGLIIPRSYSDYINKTDAATLSQALQLPSVMDSTPTENSNRPVRSGGIYTALANKQDTLTFDDAPTSGSNNPVKSGAVATALANKQDTLTFDDAPTSGSNNPVKSGGIYRAIQDTVGVDFYDYPSAKWAPGMTSIDVTSIMSAKERPDYDKFPIAYSKNQNFIQVSFSTVENDKYYMNVYNGYGEPLTTSIEIDFIYIKHR